VDLLLFPLGCAFRRGAGCLPSATRYAFMGLYDVSRMDSFGTRTLFGDAVFAGLRVATTYARCALRRCRDGVRVCVWIALTTWVHPTLRTVV